MHESTLEVVRGLVEPLLEREGVDLVDLELKGAPGRQVLRVFVDVDGGITIDQCVLLSRKISDLLDRKDPIPGKYRLEVSSPGVDRPLTRPRDFQRNIGREVKVDVRRGEAVEQVTGKIVSVGEENLALDVKGEEVLLEWTAVVKGKIQVRF
ncbi:MAG: ribosome maturation factor RimP [Calditrichaeota bacterium]|nr:ribosome maturation factor RimP [Calditrichota bacterium]